MKKFFVTLGFAATSFLFVLPVSAAEYQVEKGDNLWSIAEEHKTSVAELMETNNLESDLIFPEQKLEIDKELTYIVEKGDSLSEIAVEHDVTVSDLKEWNKLETDLIIIGEKLMIKDSKKAKEEDTEQKAQAEQTANKDKQQESTKEETPEASEPAVEQTNSQKEASSEKSGETISVSATAYTAQCEGCSGVTATGIDLNENPNMKVIAVDPNVIPLGSRVYVEGYGEAIAADTGGAIKGNKIDVHVPNKDEAFDWGVKTVDVTILE
ncbi:LysM peptidoglycan-binding domain-containing protein [Gracilibacillus caseinilyticus]|uniref:LysM peptidoglycan-binding domain-containing protein n=1 Tax=Gracilibacillus caseinilyticus TaxID=2932256 RepID=A0ABY4F0R5_9BACI|nr:3D domain-containing protein [Gracilibacillus caseinilyticus]UOQ50113.1 LysM peptidoglycan-binding domain-containing protein [Gracilibacillus caseinilyticus]